ncbi:DUF2970 domain-containing protein, partial [Pseudomonas sp. S32]|nr:DUF2970 domain-containing protein [Pseudomonas sp. S32]
GASRAALAPTFVSGQLGLCHWCAYALAHVAVPYRACHRQDWPGKNRARDFTHGKASHFIVLGVLFTLAFVAVLIGLVQLALHLAR